MKTESNKTPTSRRPSKAKKSRTSEAKAMAESVISSETNSKSVEREPDFPEEWVSIAAYYIWKNDGQPQGRDAHYWERAKAELNQLWKEGNLPTGWKSSEEER
jgi:hypothetical protein